MSQFHLYTFDFQDKKEHSVQENSTLNVGDWLYYVSARSGPDDVLYFYRVEKVTPKTVTVLEQQFDGTFQEIRLKKKTFSQVGMNTYYGYQSGRYSFYHILPAQEYSALMTKLALKNKT